MQRHAPLRPLWICTADALPWPCAQARLDLVAEYAGERVNLAVDLAGLFVEATADLTRICPEPLDPIATYQRFLGWVKTMPRA
ncbi:flavin reductase [Micromonospora rifamycinica]|uniref:flavin reductase n=1 Tax=Micromonospora rifamycinica TaxID=291594 RepID=UPI0034496A85